MTDAEGKTTQTEYNRAGDVRKVTDPKGLVTEYDYNAHHQVMERRDPSSGGRQMYAHWGDNRHHILTLSSPQPNHVLHGVGVALAAGVWPPGRFLTSVTPVAEREFRASFERIDGATGAGGRVAVRWERTPA